MSASIPERRDRLLPEVERSRRQLREALDDLQESVRNRLDVRQRIAADPGSWLLGGFLVGLWIASRR